jgi:hypothetical protein
LYCELVSRKKPLVRKMTVPFADLYEYEWGRVSAFFIGISCLKISRPIIPVQALILNGLAHVRNGDVVRAAKVVDGVGLS